MKFGHTTASLLIAKLHASSQQNSLARALQEYGRLVRMPVSRGLLTGRLCGRRFAVWALRRGLDRR
jgi:Tn3 transposase DDE domain